MKKNMYSDWVLARHHLPRFKGGHTFFTHSLKRNFEQYELTPDGKLLIEEYDEVDQSNKSAKTKSERMISSRARVNKRWVATGYSGIVVLGGHVDHDPPDGMWQEKLLFNLEFLDGLLVVIKPINL